MTQSKKDKSGSLTRERFLLQEVRTVAQLVLQGLSDEDIMQTMLEDNLFQFPTKVEIRSITRSCLERLTPIKDDEQMLRLLVNASFDVAAQINVYLLMKHYDLVRCMLVNEIGERYRTLDYSFSKMDMSAFIDDYLYERDIDWADSTIKRIKGTLHQILIEGKYQVSNSDELLFVFLNSDLEDFIRSHGDEDLLPAFNM